MITLDSLKSVRPGYGLAPKYLNKIIGQRILTNVSYGTPQLLLNIMEDI